MEDNGSIRKLYTLAIVRLHLRTKPMETFINEVLQLFEAAALILTSYITSPTVNSLLRN